MNWALIANMYYHCADILFYVAQKQITMSYAERLISGMLRLRDIRISCVERLVDQYQDYLIMFNLNQTIPNCNVLLQNRDFLRIVFLNVFLYAKSGT